MSYWDQVAGDFDRLYDSERRVAYAMNRMLRRGLYQRTEICCAVIRQLDSPSVLDVGCGSGRNLMAFLEAGAREVTGIDSAAGMLEIARRITGDVRDRVKLIHGDFLVTNLAGQYDLVVALGVFDYLENAALEFLIRMRGLAARSVVFSAPGRSLVRMPLRAWRYRRKGMSLRFYRPEELRKMCRQAGFESCCITPCRSSGYLVTARTEKEEPAAQGPGYPHTTYCDLSFKSGGTSGYATK